MPASTSLTIFGTVPLVVFMPLLGLLINLALGRRLGERFVSWVACCAAVLALALSVALAVGLFYAPGGAVIHLADWIQVGQLGVPWDFRVDTLSVTMMLLVTGVGSLIHIYASGYMHEDVRFNQDPGRYPRFFVYFNLFLATMLILVSADSFPMMFVGWEGVGLCSYLLISFWYEKGKDGIGNAVAGRKAFVTTRVGDMGFLLAMFLVYWTFGSLRFGPVFSKAQQLGPAVSGACTGITLLLALGAVGKSAQIPLQVWLPDAMAGPTPVSALIHAATMVTAGIFMVARMHVLFALAPLTQEVVAFLGAITALFAATIALAQSDIKKVLAYSTISQLGYMMAAAGLGAYVAAMFHLVTHAFFKALLFLGAGSVIQALERGHRSRAPAHDSEGRADTGQGFNAQDMRNMGGLWRKMPVTACTYLLAALALAGIPPTAGFFSKDEILTAAAGANVAVYVLLALGAFLTALYMTRQVWLIFLAAPRTSAAEDARESPWVMTVPLAALAVGAVVGGLLNYPGGSGLAQWLNHTLGEREGATFGLAIPAISTGAALLAVFLGVAAYRSRESRPGASDPLQKILGPAFVFLENGWRVDQLYDLVILRPYHWLAGFMANWVDTRAIDASFDGLGSLARTAGAGLRLLQVGKVRTYLLIFLVAAILMLGYFLLFPRGWL
jgi:NADH-quinone oxidoreductase subunit L